MRVLEEISYGLVRASTVEKHNLKGLMNSYENGNKSELKGLGSRMDGKFE